MAETGEGHEPFSWPLAAGRVGTGLAQGLALWLLGEATRRQVWPADHPALYGALLLVLALVPLIVVGGLGRIRPLTLAAWAGLAAVVLAVFAWHDFTAQIWEGSGAFEPKRLAPAFQVAVFGGVFVFIGHHLVGPADAERRIIPSYSSYFDWAWKDAVQLTLSALFVGVLWVSLELGAQLFKLIGVGGFAGLIDKPWFSLPVTTTAFAAAVQLTDVRVGLIRSVRTVGLVLLSWLLPVMTLIAVAFLCALPFTGLSKLFGAGSAAATLLAAAAVLIVLVSAAYQDGQTAKTPLVLRLAGRAAGLALVPMAAIAAYALWLRANQYGLSPARIEGLVCVLVGAGFAGGYAYAAVRFRGPWMAPIARTNVVMAMISVLAIVCLFTPVADAARLSVDNQVSRLVGGRVDAAHFDFDFLRYHSGEYGRAALAKLSALKGAPAKVAAAQQAAQSLQQPSPGTEPPRTLAQRVTVYPAGAALPPDFLAFDWQDAPDAPVGCLKFDSPCDAILIDVDGGGAKAVVIWSPSTEDAYVVKKAKDGAWRNIGRLTGVTCPGVLDAMRLGQTRRIPAERPDLTAAGRRLTILDQDCWANGDPVIAPVPPNPAPR